MTESSEAWMDDGDPVGFIESEEENEEKEENLKQPENVDIKIEPKSSAIDLPMTESSEAWMDDGDPVGFIESEEENDLPGENLKQTENVGDQERSVNKSISAMDEALRFSFDNNETETDYEVVQDVTVSDNVESTSWAFVASKESCKQTADNSDSVSSSISKKVSATNP